MKRVILASQEAPKRSPRTKCGRPPEGCPIEADGMECASRKRPRGKLHVGVTGSANQVCFACAITACESHQGGGQAFDEMRGDLSRGVPRVGIGEGTVIRRAIIDKNTRIGKNARLLNESGVAEAEGPGGAYFIRDGIIIVPKNAVIPDGTVI